MENCGICLFSFKFLYLLGRPINMSENLKILDVTYRYLAPFRNECCGKASAERKPRLFLHFDPLSAILDFIESRFSLQTPGNCGLTVHPPAKFQDKRQTCG